MLSSVLGMVLRQDDRPAIAGIGSWAIRLVVAVLAIVGAV